MALIVKPVSAQLMKDHDFIGKSVHFLLLSGSILCYHARVPKTKDKGLQRIRPATLLVIDFQF